MSPCWAGQCEWAHPRAHAPARARLPHCAARRQPDNGTAFYPIYRCAYLSRVCPPGTPPPPTPFVPSKAALLNNGPTRLLPRAHAACLLLRYCFQPAFCCTHAGTHLLSETRVNVQLWHSHPLRCLAAVCWFLIGSRCAPGSSCVGSRIFSK